ncbi:MAG: hypothetical protein LBR08_00590 [Bacteroidales bacterium]|jgi:hypothetical protein|nr:hypothetical protein [Bacteroidales bacterium]
MLLTGCVGVKNDLLDDALCVLEENDGEVVLLSWLYRDDRKEWKYIADRALGAGDFFLGYTLHSGTRRGIRRGYYHLSCEVLHVIPKGNNAYDMEVFLEMSEVYKKGAMTALGIPTGEWEKLSAADNKPAFEEATKILHYYLEHRAEIEVITE